jgi:hypothetical protein
MNTMTAKSALDTGLNEPLFVIDVIGSPDGSHSTYMYWTSSEKALVNSDAVNRARSLDKDWFRTRPHRTHRLRRATPGEFPGAKDDTWVVVRQRQPGIRLRLPFQALTSLPSEEAPEHIAHAMYDLLSEARGKPVFLHEISQRSRVYAVVADPEDPNQENPQYRH